MSRAVFGSFIHHNPTKGGAAENNKFQRMYNYTLLLYERVREPSPVANIGQQQPDASLRSTYTSQAWLNQCGEAAAHRAEERTGWSKLGSTCSRSCRTEYKASSQPASREDRVAERMSGFLL